jgi:2-polyprenyl-3-methyl-5-hydroxy-6-metoxy-1,4-benzoquinol methylase
MLPFRRRVVDEIMDGPDVAPSDHARALAGLRRINAVSNAAAQMAQPIIRLAHQQKLTHLTMLDIACGGGDVPVAIAKAAAQAGVAIQLTLLDRSETALKLARETAHTAGIAADTIQANLLENWNLPTFDIVTCSLFLHHIPEPAGVIDLLARMRAIARRLVVISDLRRCRTGLLAAWIGGHIFSRSPIVHFDAPASVRAAWTRGELTDFSAHADMKAAKIERCWPWRMLLTYHAAGNVE